jgi:hypothetical protein
VFEAPKKHFDSVKDTIDAVVQQILMDMQPVEHEIKDAGKIAFIKLNYQAINA